MEKLLEITENTRSKVCHLSYVIILYFHSFLWCLFIYIHILFIHSSVVCSSAYSSIHLFIRCLFIYIQSSLVLLYISSSVRPPLPSRSPAHSRQCTARWPRCQPPRPPASGAQWPRTESTSGSPSPSRSDQTSICSVPQNLKWFIIETIWVFSLWLFVSLILGSQAAWEKAGEFRLWQTELCVWSLRRPGKYNY